MEIGAVAYAWSPPWAAPGYSPSGAQPAGALPADSGAPGATDPLAEAAIRKAESAVTQDSSGSSASERARAQGTILAAKALAAQGAYAAARIMAEQAARQAEPETPALPGQKEESVPGEAKKPEEGGGGPKKAPAGQRGEESGGMTYQDSSHDANASMQSPTQMTAGQAAIMVPAHEQGHLIHAQAQAMANGQEVVAAYTIVHYTINPNTGEFVPSGGQAVVMTRPKPEVQLPFQSWTA